MIIRDLQKMRKVSDFAAIMEQLREAAQKRRDEWSLGMAVWQVGITVEALFFAELISTSCSSALNRRSKACQDLSAIPTNSDWR